MEYVRGEYGDEDGQEREVAHGCVGSKLALLLLGW